MARKKKYTHHIRYAIKELGINKDLLGNFGSDRKTPLMSELHNSIRETIKKRNPELKSFTFGIKGMATFVNDL